MISPLTEEETKAQRRFLSCPRGHSWFATEPGFSAGPLSRQQLCRPPLTYGCSVTGKGHLCHTTGPGEPGHAAKAGVMDSPGSRGPCRAWNWPVLKKPRGGFRWPKYARGYSVRSCKPAEELERNALTGTRPPAFLREPCASPDVPSFYRARPGGPSVRDAFAGEQSPPGVRWHPERGWGRSPRPVRQLLPPRGCVLPSARPRARPLCPSRPAPTPGERGRSQGVWAALVLPPSWLWAFISRPTPSAASARLPGSSKLRGRASRVDWLPLLGLSQAPESRTEPNEDLSEQSEITLCQ